MSLINDMLKDLDARRARPAADVMTALPTGETGRGNGSHLPLVAAISVLLLAGLLAFAWIADVPASIRAIAGIDHIGKSHDVQGRASAAGDRMPGAALQGAPANANLPVSGASVTETEIDHELARKPATEEKTTPVGAALAANNVSAVQFPARAAPAANRETQPAPPPGITARKPTPAQRADRDYRAAARAAADGRGRDAIDGLERALRLDADHREARLLLASLYARRQRTAAAGRLLSDGLARHPKHPPYTRLQAQLMIAKGQFADALAVLRTALPTAVDDADYHALIAGLYQRTGRPAEAARHYTAALQLAPANGTWWMGLGLSREQAGQANDARDAYRQALQYPVNADVQDFINQRLHRLQAPAAGITTTETQETG